MAENLALNRSTALDLLNPNTLEEQLHAWKVNYSQDFFDVPFLRLWDQYSGSQPNDKGCMKSREPRQRLDTRQLRKTSLTTHINHGIWTPTPYISFTTLPAALPTLASQRAKRGSQTLTVVDPNTRLRHGLPVLHVNEEMQYYQIQDPYGKSNEYYKDHYVCPWEITAEEIIGHWKWDNLVAHDNWYQEIILPAFRQRQLEKRPIAPGLEDGRFDFSAIKQELSLLDNVPDPRRSFHGDSDEASEGFACPADDGDDTDDEVEASNADDDFLKAIEG